MPENCAAFSCSNRRTIASTARDYFSQMKIALIGQSLFGQEVYKELKDGHMIVGVFTIPDKDGKVDPLATEAEKDGVPVFNFPRWRLKGKAITEVVDQYRAVKMA